MSSYSATVRWSSKDPSLFVAGRYSRAHQWAFDGGVVVAASASSHNVPSGTADDAAVDPEEAFVAAVASCHMLFFLDYARRAGFVLDSYEDGAVGQMERRADGTIAVTKVTLRPKTSFVGDQQPSLDEIELLHHRSHRDCFIANSINSEVSIEL